MLDIFSRGIAWSAAGCSAIDFLFGGSGLLGGLTHGRLPGRQSPPKPTRHSSSQPARRLHFTMLSGAGVACSAISLFGCIVGRLPARQPTTVACSAQTTVACSAPTTVASSAPTTVACSAPTTVACSASNRHCLLGHHPTPYSATIRILARPSPFLLAACFV
ncbi:hypothetical protein Dimus_023046 [Dionaea muscipula]